jgi:FeS assembly SUF system protein
VGLFSFLTGKTDEKEARPDAEAPKLPPPSAVDTTPPPAAVGEHPHPSADSPFSAPEAWNLDALTAPKPAQAGEVPQIGPMDPAKTAEFQPKIVEVIKTVYDPEIPVDIYELGLIYDIVVDADSRALIRMTLTSPACPSAQQLPQEVRYKVKAIPGITEAWVEIVWEPPWGKERMSEAAKLTLGFF